MKAKKIMKAEEAHSRLNHLSQDAVTQSINANIFVDVNQLSGENSRDCKICSTGKRTRHTHYNGSMNFYSQLKEPGE